MSVAAVVLAAGGASRWDGDGHKLMADLDGRPVAAHALGAAAEAALDELVVVVGAVDLGVCLPEGATVLENPDWASGQAGSLQVAVAHCRTVGHDAIVFGLADTPGVPASAWRSVAEQPGELVCATFGGRRRPPVKVAASRWPDLPADGDEGARALLAQQASQVVEVVCRGEPRDIDTVEDLRAWS